MLLAYCKQITQNQRKTVRKAVTITMCRRKSSCELFTLATSHIKEVNSGSGKMVIARYRIRYFFQKTAALRLTLLEISYCLALTMDSLIQAGPEA